MLKRKSLMAAAGLAMAYITFLGVAYLWRDSVHPAICERIHKGMTYDEACAVVGRDCDDTITYYPDSTACNYWFSSAGTLSVHVNQARIVESARFEPKRGDALWRRVHCMLGLEPVPVLC